ncbi:anthrone oxygenase family protein [Nonomuraea sp. NPDC004354]
MTRVVWFAALTATGLMAGIMAGGVLTARAMLGQPAAVYSAVARPTHQTFALPMTAVALVAIAATATLLTMLWRRRPRRVAATAVALLCLLGAITTTLVVNVPINGQMIHEWPGRIPADWAQIRDRWNTWHVVRAALSIIALGCLAAARAPRFRAPRSSPAIEADDADDADARRAG